MNVVEVWGYEPMSRFPGGVVVLDGLELMQ